MKIGLKAGGSITIDGRTFSGSSIQINEARQVAMALSTFGVL